MIREFNSPLTALLGFPVSLFLFSLSLPNNYHTLSGERVIHFSLLKEWLVPHLKLLVDEESLVTFTKTITSKR
jgi:hypothetical protein